MASSQTANNVINIVYYYPPSQFTANDFISYSIDSNAFVNVTFQPSGGGVIGVAEDISTFLSTILPFLPKTGQTPYGAITGSPVTVSMTPQAFTAWYSANLTSVNSSGNASTLAALYKTLTSPVLGTNLNALGNYPNYEAYNAAIIKNSGYIWEPFSTWYSSSNVNPIWPTLPGTSNSTYLLNNQSQLYVLLQPNETTITLANIPTWMLIGITAIGVILVLIFIFKMVSGPSSVLYRAASESRKAKAYETQTKKQRDRDEKKKPTHVHHHKTEIHISPGVQVEKKGEKEG